MNAIGLDENKTKNLAVKLNSLLAAYQVFYMNTRGFHWNIKGDKFFELHAKFEELYTDLLVKVDEVAERVLTLGVTPLHTFDDYVRQSVVKTVHDVSNGKEAVKLILEAFKDLLVLEREILALSSETGDEGTNALMSDYIREKEKLVWMYSSYLG
ncbi:MAG TPA: Dps family protein [Bacteroidales bacterium]|nr:Dps family protein [Bacteroidales bacterium]